MDHPPIDSRRYFMLPQAPEEAGYYTYGLLHGVPARGASHYAHPLLMTAILRVEREWQLLDDRKFGVGDISMAGGPDHPDHATHELGLEVDIRPIRRDGRHLPVTIQETSQYDFEATAALIGLFRTYADVLLIYFNDQRIPFVRRARFHDNHFHVSLRG